MLRTIIIAFSGPDGAGKTSYANELAKLLSENRCDVRRIWIKHVHTVAYIMVKLLGRS